MFLMFSLVDFVEGWFMLLINPVLAILYLIAGLLTFRKPASVLRILRPGMDEEDVVLPAEKIFWIELIAISLSLWFLLSTLPELLGTLVNFIYDNPNDEGEKLNYWTIRTSWDFGYVILKIVIAILILFNARNIARRLTRMGDRDDAIARGDN